MFMKILSWKEFSVAAWCGKNGQKRIHKGTGEVTTPLPSLRALVLFVLGYALPSRRFAVQNSTHAFRHTATHEITAKWSSSIE